MGKLKNVMLKLLFIVLVINVSFCTQKVYAAKLVMPNTSSTLLPDEGELVFNVNPQGDAIVSVTINNVSGNMLTDSKAVHDDNESVIGLTEVYRYKYKKSNLGALSFRVTVTSQYPGSYTPKYIYETVRYKYESSADEDFLAVPYIENYEVIESGEEKYIHVYYNGNEVIESVEIVDADGDGARDAAGGTIVPEIVRTNTNANYATFKLSGLEKAVSYSQYKFSAKITYKEKTNDKESKFVYQKVVLFWNSLQSVSGTTQPYVVDRENKIIEELPFRLAIRSNGTRVKEVSLVGANHENTVQTSGGEVTYETSIYEVSSSYLDLTKIIRNPGAKSLVFTVRVKYTQMASSTEETILCPVELYFDPLFGQLKPPGINVISDMVLETGNTIQIYLNENEITNVTATSENDNVSVVSFTQTATDDKKKTYLLTLKQNSTAEPATTITINIDYKDKNGEEKMYTRTILMKFKELTVEEEDSFTGSGVYGNPDDLEGVLDYKNGIGAVIHAYARILMAVLTFTAVILIGINIIMARHKAEERVNAMTGLMYVIIGIIILDAVVAIYLLMTSVIGNQAAQVESVTGINVETSADATGTTPSTGGGGSGSPAPMGGGARPNFAVNMIK